MIEERPFIPVRQRGVGVDDDVEGSDAGADAREQNRPREPIRQAGIGAQLRGFVLRGDVFMFTQLMGR